MFAVNCQPASLGPSGRLEFIPVPEPGGTGMWGHVYPVYTGLVHAFVSFFSLFLLYSWHKWSLFLKSRGSVVLSLVSAQF